MHQEAYKGKKSFGAKATAGGAGYRAGNLFTQADTCHGAGGWGSVDAACDAVVHVAGRTAPDQQAVIVMQKSYARYRRIYPALRSIFADSSA